MRPGGDGGFRRSSPLRGSPPFSGANAGSILRLRPGLSFGCDSRAGVSKSGHFTHDMTFFHHDVRGKRFNTHRELHCMEMNISKGHVAEKPRAGVGPLEAWSPMTL